MQICWGRGVVVVRDQVVMQENYSFKAPADKELTVKGKNMTLNKIVYKYTDIYDFL